MIGFTIISQQPFQRGRLKFISQASSVTNRPQSLIMHSLICASPRTCLDDFYNVYDLCIMQDMMDQCAMPVNVDQSVIRFFISTDSTGLSMLRIWSHIDPHWLALHIDPSCPDNVYNVTFRSLLQCSLDTIVCDGELTEICVSLGLPSAIHIMLFTATAALIPK